VTALVEECTQWTIVELHGTLRAPADMTLREKVDALLGRGERQIVLDLAGISAIDAAGIGELIRAYHTTIAAGGVMRIARARGRVRLVLKFVGVLNLLSGNR
jgi:anti-anti-sigma factor